MHHQLQGQRKTQVVFVARDHRAFVDLIRSRLNGAPASPEDCGFEKVKALTYRLKSNGNEYRFTINCTRLSAIATDNNLLALNGASL